LDDENRQRLADLGFATAPGNAVAIFVNEADQAQIADFKPTVYRFDAAAFERTPSNEFVSRKPVTAIGIEQFTMPVVVARWKIQVIAVPDVHECEKRLQQAGIECAMQTNRRSDVAFRPLTAAEEAAGYQVICDTVDWLRSKGIKLWEKPLPRETYAARQQRGENYGLFVGGELAGIVSLVRGAAQQWAEELPDRRIMWMSTLTTANAFRGRGLGRQIVEQAISHLAGRGEKMLYLDCKPGFLAEFYSGTGFEEVARKTATINRGAACYLAEVVLMRRVL
jgi:GNAT superfamily N-acetyltransferase